MKRVILFLILILTGWNCSSQPSELYIKDKKQYDQIFIDGLSRFKGPIRLIDNYIIAEGGITYFPEVLKLKREIKFRGKKNDQQFDLMVTRINLTSLSYSFSLKNHSDNRVITRSGKAVLGSMFFLGCETDIDDCTAEGYSSYEYWDNSNDAWLSIRVGTEKDKNGKLRAKVTFGGNSPDIKVIGLEECPTMRME